MRNLLILGVLAAGLAVAGAPNASAEERTCRGTLGAITVDNLRVPQSATCTLNGTRVQGTIKVERDATLTANRVRVVGNVQGENAANVRVLDGSTVGGSVQVVHGRAARVAHSTVNGDILFDEIVTPPVFWKARSSVGADRARRSATASRQRRRAPPRRREGLSVSFARPSGDGALDLATRLGVGVAYGIIGGDLGQIPRLAGASLVIVPAMWVARRRGARADSATWSGRPPRRRPLARCA